MSKSEHQWAPGTGRWGRPVQQRQCQVCEIWETRLSRATPCPGRPMTDAEVRELIEADLREEAMS